MYNASDKSDFIISRDIEIMIKLSLTPGKGAH